MRVRNISPTDDRPGMEPATIAAVNLSNRFPVFLSIFGLLFSVRPISGRMLFKLSTAALRSASTFAKCPCSPLWMTTPITVPVDHCRVLCTPPLMASLYISMYFSEAPDHRHHLAVRPCSFLAIVKLIVVAFAIVCISYLAFILFKFLPIRHVVIIVVVATLLANNIFIFHLHGSSPKTSPSICSMVCSLAGGSMANGRSSLSVPSESGDAGAPAGEALKSVLTALFEMPGTISIVRFVLCTTA